MNHAIIVTITPVARSSSSGSRRRVVASGLRGWRRRWHRASRWISRWAADATRSCWRAPGSATFGVDVQFDAVRDAIARARRRRAARARLVRRPDAASAAARRDSTSSSSRATCSAICFPRSASGGDAGRGRALRDVHDGAARARAGRRRRITCSNRASCAERFDGFEVLFYEEVTAPRRSRGSWRDRRSACSADSRLQRPGTLKAALRDPAPSIALQSTNRSYASRGSDTLPGCAGAVRLVAVKVGAAGDREAQTRRPSPDNAPSPSRRDWCGTPRARRGRRRPSRQSSRRARSARMRERAMPPARGCERTPRRATRRAAGTNAGPAARQPALERLVRCLAT